MLAILPRFRMSDAVSPERPHGELITTTLRVMTWNVWGRFGPWHEREAALIRTFETLAELIGKPFTHATLVAKIQRLLRRTA